MGISSVNSRIGVSRFSLQSQDSQSTIFPSSSSLTAEVSLPEKIESSFLTETAFNRPFPKIMSLEMVSFVTMSYTSLKDLLPPSTPGVSSSSWDEIPIKNRLVQKAASFYLMPMSSSREPDPGFFEWLGVSCSFHCRSNSECVRGCGCFEFFNQRIRETFQRIFGGNRRRRSVEFSTPLTQKEEEEGINAGDC